MSCNETYLGNQCKLVLERGTVAGLKMFFKSVMKTESFKMYEGGVWWVTGEISIHLGS